MITCLAVVPHGMTAALSVFNACSLRQSRRDKIDIKVCTYVCLRGCICTCVRVLVRVCVQMDGYSSDADIHYTRINEQRLVHIIHVSVHNCWYAQVLLPFFDLRCNHQGPPEFGQHCMCVSQLCVSAISGTLKVCLLILSSELGQSASFDSRCTV